MPIKKNKSSFILLIGDIGLFCVSLYLALWLRYLELPDPVLVTEHFTAFSVLFIVWALVFFIAGLYDKKSLLLPQSLWQRILKIQVVNILIAVVFFYTIPFFAIAPKTNLFIYLVLSSGLLLTWRHYAMALLQLRSPSRAVLVASESVGQQLKERLSVDGYGLVISRYVDPDTTNGTALYEAVASAVRDSSISFVVLDMQHSAIQAVLPRLYNLLYKNVYFITLDSLYEVVFDRIALSRLQPEWFVEHIRRTPHTAYDVTKRGMDIIIASTLFLITLPLYPLIALVIWLEDQGAVFYVQKRLGQLGKTIYIKKFRTMSESPTDSGKKSVTRVGSFLRRTRLDELPQLLGVIKGNLSLIGPRPETPQLAAAYQQEIPYYHARHLIKPGLSGWAQLHQQDPGKFSMAVKETQEKLSYDLYYVKNRSLLLDIKIALWTLRVLSSRSGQ